MNESFTRAASFAPSTLDRAARTVEVIALSGAAPVLRGSKAPDGSDGPWWEELDARGADLSSFIGGPVLKDHRPQVDSHIGVIDGARVEGDRIFAGVRFGTKPVAEEVFTDVEGGLLRGVSLGYSVQSWQRGAPRDGRPVFRAVKWKARELSFVPIPADAGAIVRGEEVSTEQTPAPQPAAQEPPEAPTVLDGPANAPAEPSPPQVADQTHPQKEEPAVTTAPIETRSDPVAAVVPPVNRAAINAEIRTIARASGLDQAWIDSQIDASATVEHARSAAMDAILTRQAPITPTAHVIVDHTDPAAIRSRMADAVVAKLSNRDDMPDAARQFAYHSILDMGAELANTRGAKLNPKDTAGVYEHLFSRSGFHTSSDFPLLLADTANKVLLSQYQMASPTYRQIASPRSFNDFKPHKFLRLGDFPSFKNLKESGEVNFGTISENRETVTPEEFGTGFGIGRKAILSDDLRALSDFAIMIGNRAAQFENSQVYGVLSGDGPTMSDGKAMFHADHGNKAGSGTTIANGIDAAVLAMRTQTGLDGSKLSIEPRFLVVGPAKEAEARRVLAAINPTKVSDVNVWANAFTLIVDPEITGNRWFLAASPAQVPTLIYGYVNGANGPQIRTEIDFDTRGLKVAAGLDFAADAIDFRGFYSNAGA